MSEKQAEDLVPRPGLEESPDVCISSLESGGALCSPLSKILDLGVVVCRSLTDHLVQLLYLHFPPLLTEPWKGEVT